MKRFLIAAAFAVALGLGTSSKAHAQIVYGYSVPTIGGVETAGTVVSPLGTKTFTNFYNPFTGASVGQSYTTNIFGAANTRVYGYNPWNGLRYGSGFYQPNAVTMPFNGVNYGWLRRR